MAAKAITAGQRLPRAAASHRLPGRITWLEDSGAPMRARIARIRSHTVLDSVPFRRAQDANGLPYDAIDRRVWHCHRLTQHHHRILFATVPATALNSV